MVQIPNDACETSRALKISREESRSSEATSTEESAVVWPTGLRLFPFCAAVSFKHRDVARSMLGVWTRLSTRPLFPSRVRSKRQQRRENERVMGDDFMMLRSSRGGEWCVHASQAVAP